MRSEPPFVLAVDIGTSSVKAGLYDALARQVPDTEVRVAHAVRTAADGAAEEDAEALAASAETAIDGVLSLAAGAQQQITAVALDSMASTFVGMNRDGAAATPVFLYSDTRNGDDVDELRREIDEAAIYQETGCPQHTSYLPGRLRWLRRTRRELFDSVTHWADVPTFLYRRWFGRADIPCSFSIASWSGLLDRRLLEWHQGLAGHLGLDTSCLPRLAPLSDSVSGLSDAYLRRWKALADKPFFLGVGDGLTANVGSGCVIRERVALTIGTTTALRTIVPGTPERVPPGLWAYRQDPEFTLLGGAFSEGGNLLLWAQDALRLPPADQWDRLLSTMDPGVHGLTVLPFLAGERATGWSSRASGVINGLRVSTTPQEILLALIEAVACRVRLLASRLIPELGVTPDVIAVGGALQASRHWTQTMSDALQLPVTVSLEPQDTSRGAAILALHSLGVWTRLDQLPARTGSTFEPRREFAEVFAVLAERQNRLYEQVLGRPRFG